MNDLQNFIISKGLEKASLELIKEAIRSEPTLSSETKEFWLGYIKDMSITKDVVDIINLLNNRY
jgi:hypothetical protein